MECPISRSSAQIVIKKSIFTAHLIPITSQEEALLELARLKKASPGAKHHVYCYVLGPKGALFKFSDDGEPAGTGGRPLLSLLKAKKMTNSLLEVDRIFGGILLGTGGLSRAYSEAAALAIARAETAPLIQVARITAILPLAASDRALALLGRQRIITKSFAENATFSAIVPLDEIPALITSLAPLEGKEGKVTFEEAGWQVLAKMPSK